MSVCLAVSLAPGLISALASGRNRSKPECIPPKISSTTDSKPEKHAVVQTLELDAQSREEHPTTPAPSAGHGGSPLDREVKCQGTRCLPNKRARERERSGGKSPGGKGTSTAWGRRRRHERGRHSLLPAGDGRGPNQTHGNREVERLKISSRRNASKRLGAGSLGSRGRARLSDDRLSPCAALRAPTSRDAASSPSAASSAAVATPGTAATVASKASRSTQAPPSFARASARPQ